MKKNVFNVTKGMSSAVSISFFLYEVSAKEEGGREGERWGGEAKKVRKLKVTRKMGSRNFRQIVSATKFFYLRISSRYSSTERYRNSVKFIRKFRW